MIVRVQQPGLRDNQPGNGPDGPGCEQLLRRKYQALARKHLSRMLDQLFTGYTGLHFAVAWAAPSAEAWARQRVTPGRASCCLAAASRDLPRCRTCAAKLLRSSLHLKRGKAWTCPLGVRQFWLRIRIRDVTVGVVSLKALAHAPDGQRKRNINAAVITGLRFARAKAFLQHIVQHVEVATLCDLGKAEASNADRAVLALETEQNRLHQVLQSHLPCALEAPRSLGRQSHSEQVVRFVLERVERGYAKPVTLRSLASELGMNAAYLSALFSNAMGVPFKTYLTELRLQRAKEMLSQGIQTVAGVAFGVGYASQERFRSAFKRATGLSPTAWRQTMDVKPWLKSSNLKKQGLFQTFEG